MKGECALEKFADNIQLGYTTQLIHQMGYLYSVQPEKVGEVGQWELHEVNKGKCKVLPLGGAVQCTTAS